MFKFLKNRKKDFLFILNSVEKGELQLRYNPLEWAETEVGFDRDSENDGTSFTFTGEYTYPKDGYDYIKDGLNKYGILWVCTLTIKAINTHSKGYDTLIDSKKLDFTSRPEKSDSNGKNISISLVDSEFHENLRAYENEEIPYSRLETITGLPITPYTDEYEVVNVLGYETFGTGLGTGTDVANNSVAGIKNNICPLSFESNNDGVSSTFFRPITTPGEIFANDLFLNLDADGIVDVDFTFNFNYSSTEDNITVILFRTFTTSTGEISLGAPLFVQEYLPAEPNPKQAIINLPNIILSNGDGMVMVLNTVEDDKTMTTLSTSVLNLSITQKAPPTDLNHVLVWNAHDRLATAITGESGSFRSSVFEPGGIYETDCLSNGYLYRQYPTIPTVPEIENEVTAQLSFKWKDLTKNIAIAREVGYGIINENGKNIIICEKKEFFYKENVVAIINDYKRGSFLRDIDNSKYISSINTGVKKKEYDAEGALIDYTTKANYTTILGGEFNLFDLEMTYQTSGNWAEESRRLIYDATKTTDSKFDNDIFMLETIMIEGVRTQRTTQDFDTITGIDDITTPMNLNLTPGRIIQRYGKWLNTGLFLYPDSVIKFGKSEVLTKLSTVRSDESIEIFENKDINASTLDPRKFTGDVVNVLADINMNDISNIEANQYQKAQIKDEITGDNVQGWFLSASTKPVGESFTNIRILEAAAVTAINKSIDWNSGEAISWISGEDIDWNK